MSILAACDWAENGGPSQPEKYPVYEDDGRRSTGTFICGTDGPYGY